MALLLRYARHVAPPFRRLLSIATTVASAAEAPVDTVTTALVKVKCQTALVCRSYNVIGASSSTISASSASSTPQTAIANAQLSSSNISISTDTPEAVLKKSVIPVKVKTLPRVAIVGRPNVGKSTLFNRLVKGRVALVADTPGMTRDRLEARAKLLDLKFTLIDTPGYDELPASTANTKVHSDMMKQTALSAASCDVVALVVDAKEGITVADEALAKWLRRQLTHNRIVLLANKCECRIPEENFLEAYRLGLGAPVRISAEHGRGKLGMFEAFSRVLDGLEPKAPPLVDPLTITGDMPDILQLAIVGRPNVGKSTLLNSLIGDTRVLTGPDPGITRDSVTIDYSFEQRRFRLVDTAGLAGVTRLSWANNDHVEALGMMQSMRAIQFASVVVLIVDVSDTKRGLGLSRREVVIAKHVLDNGRCLIVAANKIDLISSEYSVTKRIQALDEAVHDALPQAKGIPIVAISALNATHVHHILRAAMAAHTRWIFRATTGTLNRFLAKLHKEKEPPRIDGKSVKVKYISQVKGRPPSFVLFGSKYLSNAVNYTRFISDKLREEFDLRGVPIRLLCRSSDNPYKSKRPSRLTPRQKGKRFKSPKIYTTNRRTTFSKPLANSRSSIKS